MSLSSTLRLEDFIEGILTPFDVGRVLRQPDAGLSCLAFQYGWALFCSIQIQVTIDHHHEY